MKIGPRLLKLSIVKIKVAHFFETRCTFTLLTDLRVTTIRRTEVERTMNRGRWQLTSVTKWQNKITETEV